LSGDSKYAIDYLGDKNVFTVSPLLPNTLRILVLVEAASRSFRLRLLVAIRLTQMADYLQVNLMSSSAKPTPMP
jgi:hypothetical protein